MFGLGCRRSTLGDFMHEGVTSMTSQHDSAPSRKVATSRRDLVTAITAVGAASAAAATDPPQAQAGANGQKSKPSRVSPPTGYNPKGQSNWPPRPPFLSPPP